MPGLLAGLARATPKAAADAFLSAEASSSRPMVAPSCKDAPTTSTSCRFPLDDGILPPGSFSSCLPATSGPATVLPWCVLVCGNSPGRNSDTSIDSEKMCMFKKQGQSFAATTKTALIGIHGGPGQSSGIIRELVRLSSSIPVILYDQRGAGRSSELSSPARDNIESTMEAYVSELRAVVQEFVEKVHLVAQFGAHLPFPSHAHF